MFNFFKKKKESAIEKNTLYGVDIWVDGVEHNFTATSWTFRCKEKVVTLHDKRNNWDCIFTNVQRFDSYEKMEKVV